MKTKKITKSDYEQVIKLLEDNDITAEVFYDENEITVNIEWGDWNKHLRCDYVLENLLGFTLDRAVVTETKEGETNNYSASRTYIKV